MGIFMRKTLKRKESKCFFWQNSYPLCGRQMSPSKYFTNKIVLGHVHQGEGVPKNKG